MWQKKNYGKLALYFDYLFKYEDNKYLRPKECRLLFQNKEYRGFELVKVADRAIVHKRRATGLIPELPDNFIPVSYGNGYNDITSIPE